MAPHTQVMRRLEHRMLPHSKLRMPAPEIPPGFVEQRLQSPLDRWNAYFNSSNAQYKFLFNTNKANHVTPDNGSIPAGMRFGTETFTCLDADECCWWAVTSKYKFMEGVKEDTIIFSTAEGRKGTMRETAPRIYRMEGKRPIFVFPGFLAI